MSAELHDEDPQAKSEVNATPRRPGQTSGWVSFYPFARVFVASFSLYSVFVCL